MTMADQRSRIEGIENVAIKTRQNGVDTLITSSSENHGQGVAYAARALGMRSDIFLPRRPTR